MGKTPKPPSNFWQSFSQWFAGPELCSETSYVNMGVDAVTLFKKQETALKERRETGGRTGDDRQMKPQSV